MFKDKLSNWLFSTSTLNSSIAMSKADSQPNYPAGYTKFSLQLEELKRSNFLHSVSRYAKTNSLCALIFGIFIVSTKPTSTAMLITTFLTIFLTMSLNFLGAFFARNDLSVAHIAPLSKLPRYAETTALLSQLAWAGAFLALEPELGKQSELSIVFSIGIVACAGASANLFKCHPNLARISVTLLFLTPIVSTIGQTTAFQAPNVLWLALAFVYLIMNSQVVTQSENLEKLMIQQAMALNEMESTQHFFDSIPGYAFSLNENHEISHANAKFFAALRIDPKKNFNRRFDSYKNAHLLFENYESFMASDSDKMTKEIQFNSEFMRGWHLLSFQKIFGTSRSVIVIAMRIESLKKNQQEIDEQKKHLEHGNRLASIGKLAGGLAHEINNPLAIIQGLASMIRIKVNSKNELPPNINRDLERIESTCLRISKVTQSLLSLSNSNKLEDLHATASLNKVLQSVQSALSREDAQAEVDVKIDVPAMPILVKGNELLIEQVIMNLVTNGIDAIKRPAASKSLPIADGLPTADGPPNADSPPELEATITRKWVNLVVQDKDGVVKIKVSDSGSGIPQAVVNRMFDPFFTTKDVGAGKGLGLCVSRSILQGFEGTLQYLDSHPNTCFEITLKAAMQESTGPCSSHHAA